LSDIKAQLPILVVEAMTSEGNQPYAPTKDGENHLLTDKKGFKAL
jgi:hypothetical protein